MVDIDPQYVWIVVVGFVIGFILAIGIGANDVANTFGTSVGAKVLTLRQACILGSVFETLGAVLLGAKVSDTVRKGILDVGPYKDEPALFMVGNLAALTGAGIWLIVATAFKMPVSGTHSIVGAIVGFALVAKGPAGVNWTKFALIISSWFISPVLSGGVSTSIFLICKKFILTKKDPIEPGLQFLPIFYSITIIVNMFSIFFDGPDMLGFHKIPLWGTFILSFGMGIIIAILVRFLLVPWQRKKIQETMKERELERLKRRKERKERTLRGPEVSSYPEELPMKDVSVTSVDCMVQTGDDGKEGGEERIADNDGFVLSQSDLAEMGTVRQRTISTRSISVGSQVSRQSVLDAQRSLINDRPEQAKIFSFLQVLTAIFGAFAHGGNDVSNAIGPVISIWLVAQTGEVAASAPTPIWILFIGGAGISIGLWVWGRRVIQTMGEDLAKVTPSSGFSIEIGSALTVLIASNLGIPISSTHCKVGSIVFVGRVRSRDNVDWSLFRNIVLAWVLTLPVSGGLSAALMAGLQYTVSPTPANVTDIVNGTTAAFTQATTILY